MDNTELKRQIEKYKQQMLKTYGKRRSDPNEIETDSIIHNDNQKQSVAESVNSGSGLNQAAETAIIEPSGIDEAVENSVSESVDETAANVDDTENSAATEGGSIEAVETSSIGDTEETAALKDSSAETVSTDKAESNTVEAEDTAASKYSIADEVEAKSSAIGAKEIATESDDYLGAEANDEADTDNAEISEEVAIESPEIMNPGQETAYNFNNQDDVKKNYKKISVQNSKETLRISPHNNKTTFSSNNSEQMIDAQNTGYNVGNIFTNSELRNYRINPSKTAQSYERDNIVDTLHVAEPYENEGEVSPSISEENEMSEIDPFQVAAPDDSDGEVSSTMSEENEVNAIDPFQMAAPYESDGEVSSTMSEENEVNAIDPFQMAAPYESEDEVSPTQSEEFELKEIDSFQVAAPYESEGEVSSILSEENEVSEIDPFQVAAPYESGGEVSPTQSEEFELNEIDSFQVAAPYESGGEVSPTLSEEFEAGEIDPFQVAAPYESNGDVSPTMTEEIEISEIDPLQVAESNDGSSPFQATEHNETDSIFNQLANMYTDGDSRSNPNMQEQYNLPSMHYSGSEPQREPMNEGILDQGLQSVDSNNEMEMPNNFQPDFSDYRFDIGYLQVVTITGNNESRVPEVRCVVSKVLGNNKRIFFDVSTDQQGQTENLPLPVSDGELAINPEESVTYSFYNLDIEKDGFLPMKYTNVPIFDGILSTQSIKLFPDDGTNKSPSQIVINVSDSR